MLEPLFFRSYQCWQYNTRLRGMLPTFGRLHLLLARAARVLHHRLIQSGDILLYQSMDHHRLIRRGELSLLSIDVHRSRNIRPRTVGSIGNKPLNFQALLVYSSNSATQKRRQSWWWQFRPMAIVLDDVRWQKINKQGCVAIIDSVIRYVRDISWVRFKCCHACKNTWASTWFRYGAKEVSALWSPLGIDLTWNGKQLLVSSSSLLTSICLACICRLLVLFLSPNDRNQTVTGCC